MFMETSEDTLQYLMTDLFGIFENKRFIVRTYIFKILNLGMKSVESVKVL